MPKKLSAAQEAKIMKFSSEGMAAKDIAEKLKISYPTVLKRVRPQGKPRSKAKSAIDLLSENTPTIRLLEIQQKVNELLAGKKAEVAEAKKVLKAIAEAEEQSRTWAEKVEELRSEL